ncbi:Crp/Fnr family transcriptional regulator [Geobacter hydrogenophilus]|uniref:CarD family transcriptional regulator n=1 Tax=Geobacter hydrogenophilus TaxID=40983 RepID=A0A9W6G4F2_9BACT|nr:Crp/Fnr family transcriptional regulator [Geobacter hydrogenophilus]MBT0892743.1 Crp/Fnr family transcriptional regulator [Geobacter hydrogenophilus]GLI40142.1 CarD family transcriptional regulator [Geobacter hydrogenophilus]
MNSRTPQLPPHVDLQPVLRSIPLFAPLPPDDIESLSRLIDIRVFPKNRTILHEADTANYMYLVLAGKVRVVQQGADGSEQVLAIHRKGAFFGEMALLDGRTSPATLMAHEDATVGLIARTTFESQILTNDRVLRQIISVLCGRLRESWFLMKLTRFPSAEQKIRGVLKYLGTQYGVDDSRGKILTIKLTHQTVASYASVSRETASRILGRFSRNGEIELLASRRMLLKPLLFHNPPYL